MRTCSIADCDRKHYGHGLCHHHWQRQRNGIPLDAAPYRLRSLADRLWPKVDKGGPGDCWIFTGSTSTGGYGRISSGRRGVSPLAAHRVAYEMLVGPIPEGLHLDHLCRVRACVNPLHLEPVTPAENTRRAVAVLDGRCRRGHLLTESAGTRSDGRACRTCRRAAEAQYRSRNRQALAEKARARRARKAS